MKEALAVLQHVFGHPAFRPGQAEAIEAHLRDQDVTVVLPTGGGKSLCYQIPALVRHGRGEGPTVVVSPLIALMEDQVRSLREHGIEAVAFHSSLTTEQRREARRRAPDAALVYCSPERLALKGTRSWLDRIGVAAIAVDEAHCIAEWGHDFRKDYQKLGELKERWGRPTLAVTATATPRVVEEMGSALRLVSPLHVGGRFDRPNLAFKVELHRGDKVRVARVAERLEDLGLGKKSEAGRAVVYAGTRKRVVSAAKALRAAGLKVAHYHAGRSDSARATAQERFVTGRAPVLVATTAFGMGIDLPDVRLVAHLNTPHTLESYVQQAGRAGRDGAPAEALLLYAPGDVMTRKRIVKKPTPGQKAGWDAMLAYVFASDCRQQHAARWFGLHCRACGRCDACTDPQAVERAAAGATASATARKETASRVRDAADARALRPDEADLVVEFVAQLRKPVGKRLVAMGLRGSKAKNVRRAKLQDNPCYGLLTEVPERSLIRGVELLLAEGRLAPRGKKYPTVWLPEKRVRPVSTGKKPKKPSVPEDERGLRNLRRREAKKRRWKPYMVFNDKTLRALLDARPTNPAELLEVPGMGPVRVKRFGVAILEALGAGS